MDTIFLAVLLVLALGVIFLIWRGSQKPRLSETMYRQCQEFLKTIEKKDPSHALLEVHKMLIHTLKKLHPKTKGSAVVFMKKLTQRFPREASFLWDFHRLRNKIAHDMHGKVSSETLQRTLQKVRHILKKLK